MPTPNEISTQMVQALQATEPDLDAGVGTPIRKLIDTVGESISEAYLDRYMLQYTFDIDARTGPDLDAFCALFGFSRITARRSSGQVLLSRSVPATTSTVIPAGAQLATSDSPPIIVQTTSPSIFPQSSLSITVPVQSVIGGTSGNLPANSIVRWVSLIDGIAAVSNPAPLVGGSDAESDEQFRQRFKKTIFRNLAGTEDMYLGVALADTDVSSAIVLGAVEVWRERVQVVGGVATPTFALTERAADIGVSTASQSSGVVSVTTTRVHNLNAGDIVTISGVTGSIAGFVNGTYRVYSVTSSTQFVLGDLATNSNALGASGTYTSGGAIKVPLRVRWIYDTQYTVGADIDNGDVLTPGVHYTLNTTSIPPTLTSLDSTAMPDGTYDISMRYVPKWTRSDPTLGIANKVDIWQSGTREIAVTENTVVDGSILFSSTPSSPYYVGKWRHLDGTQPTAGNGFVRLGFTPTVLPPASFQIGTPLSTIGVQDMGGVSGRFVRRLDSDTLSPYATEGIELIGGDYTGTLSAAITSSTNAAPIVLTIGLHSFQIGQRVKVAGHATNTNANGVWTISAISGTTITLSGTTGNGVGGATGTVTLYTPTILDYTYNEVPRTVQESIEQWRLAGTDVVVHQGVPVPLKIYAAVILRPGYTTTSVRTPLQNTISAYLASLGFGAVMQVSDLLNVMGDTTGVDAVRLLTSADVTSLSLNAATNATPIVVTTTTPHGIATGSIVLANISGVVGNTAANGLWRVTSTGASTLSLEGSTGNGSYSSGGTLVPVNFGVKGMMNTILPAGGVDRFAVLQAYGSELRSKDIVANDNEFFTLHTLTLVEKASNTWGSV